VSNGLHNPLPGAGGGSVVPWQTIPRPRLTCTGSCASNAPRTFDVEWDPVRWYHDRSHRPSTNALVGPQDPNRQNGMGVVDFLTKLNAANSFRGLIRYDLQKATVALSNVDANGNIIDYSALSFTPVRLEVPQPIDTSTGDPNGPVLVSSVTLQ